MESQKLEPTQQFVTKIRCKLTKISVNSSTFHFLDIHQRKNEEPQQLNLFEQGD